MFNSNSPHLMAVLSGTLLGLALILASDQIAQYGWAALALYIALQIGVPAAKKIVEKKGGAL